MERVTMSSRRLRAGFLACAVSVAGAANGADRIVPPVVPSELELSSVYKPFLSGHAIGTQNYICAPAATPSGLDWLFIGPQATVYDSNGEQILTHFQSRNPLRADALHATWQHSKDTSAVWATKFRGSTDPAYVAPDAIEWLLLEMTGTNTGPTGGDKLAATTYIYRVNTVGGLKPSSAECTPSTINTRRLVPYQADYYFYK
jgi:uncharacterized protein DUF3455